MLLVLLKLNGAVGSETCGGKLGKKSRCFCNCWRRERTFLSYFASYTLRLLSSVEKSAPAHVGRYSTGAKMAVAKWLLSRWQPDFLRVSSGCSSFSREHHEAAKICLHKSVRPSMHLCLRCSCQPPRDVWLTAPPRC